MKAFIILFSILFTTHINAQVKFDHYQIDRAAKNYWLGIDFHFTRLIDAKQMRKDSLMINRFCPAWLGVFDNFESESDVRAKLRVRGFEYRSDITAYRFQELTEFVIPVKRRIEEEDIYEYLKNLELPFATGNAFIILPINMIKPQEKTEMWVVCFRVSDRQILGSSKVFGKVNGHGMTSYWGESIVNGWRRIIRKEYR